LCPRWFRGNQCNSFGLYGGDDGTRTRGLCRDRAAIAVLEILEVGRFHEYSLQTRINTEVRRMAYMGLDSPTWPVVEPISGFNRHQ
jgi:hypothetical protein